MKKAIICFGLIAILLLAGMSVTGDSTNTLENQFNIKQKEKQNSILDLPDLTIRLEDVEADMVPFGFFWLRHKFIGYMAKVYIKNSGTAPIYKENSPTLELWIIAEKDGVECYNHSWNMWNPGSFSSPINPGYERYNTFSWEYCPIGSTLKAWIDPRNLIEEVSDENNLVETIGPDSYSKALNKAQFSHNNKKFLQFIQLLVDRQKKPDNVLSLDEPKLEKKWKYKFIDIKYLYDANYTYWPLSPGFISKEQGVEGWMVGIFLKVTMTGTIKIKGSTWHDTVLIFRPFERSEARIDAEDLGITDGNYLEINASVVLTPYISASTGRIYNNELYLNAGAINIELKAYQTPPEQ